MTNNQDVISGITQWQLDRKLHEGGFKQSQSIYNFLEEIFEGCGCTSREAKSLAYKHQELILNDVGDRLVFEHDIVDSRGDMIVFAIGDLLKLGFDPNASLKEVLLEISSRKQDPEQAARWANDGRLEGEKWQKDKQQDPSTLYTANFSAALLNNNDSVKKEFEELRQDLLNENYGVIT